MRDPIKYLRRNIVCTTQTDVYPLLLSSHRVGGPGSMTFLFLGPGRRFLDVVVLEDGGHSPRTSAEMVFELRSLQTKRMGESVVFATDRTGEVPADRPDDELVWMELHALAADYRLDAIDWFVVWETKAFSVAEFAPTASGW